MTEKNEGEDSFFRLHENATSTIFPCSKEFIFKEDRPFASCHASTLLVLPNGDIFAAWFGGTKEGADDIAIWGAKRSRNMWTKPFKIIDHPSIPQWNPVLFLEPCGNIILYYKVGKKISEWSTMYMISNDGGESWSQAEPLVAGDKGGRGPVKNKPIVLSNDSWLAPASIEGEYWDAFVDCSYDNGVTWEKSGFVPINHGTNAGHSIRTTIPVTAQSFKGKGIIQPTLWESVPGKVHMLLRSTEGKIFRSDSEDYGKTWSPAYPTSLPNNNSGIDLVKMENGLLVLAYNPVGETWGPRTPLVFSISTDNGTTWEDIYVLENHEGEYSYPAIVARGKKVFITYTWKRERIAFCELEIG